jgi:beta-aspartyl-peptidase (threonine type)
MVVTASWLKPGQAEPTWSILVHGGAGASERDALRVAGCERAVTEAGALLAAGGSCLDAVQLAVRILEDDPCFNAGTGACLDEAGQLSLDAAIMEGSSLRVGAVCALPPFRNPIDIARSALEDGTHVLYAGDGAAQFAESQGFVRAPADAMITDSTRRQWQDFQQRRLHAASLPTGTVGAVAVDLRSSLAAATSTGGTLGKRRGRVGDSPIVGAGTLADAFGAASATGKGEGMLRVCLAKTAVDWLRDGADCELAARRAITLLSERTAVSGGIILADARGGLGWARATSTMAWAAHWSGSGQPTSGI